MVFVERRRVSYRTSLKRTGRKHTRDLVHNPHPRLEQPNVNFAPKADASGMDTVYARDDMMAAKFVGRVQRLGDREV